MNHLRSNSHPEGMRHFWRVSGSRYPTSCDSMSSMQLRVDCGDACSHLLMCVNLQPGPCGRRSAAPHTILSRMKCSEWAEGSCSLSHADGPLWAALLKTFRCDDACLRRLFSSLDACCSRARTLISLVPYNYCYRSTGTGLIPSVTDSKCL